MTAPIKEFGKACWAEVYNRVIGAAVFINDAAAECLHWDGGVFNLLSAGAVSVKALSPFEYAKPEHKKAVFITQTTAVELHSIRGIICNSDFTHCNLISCVGLDTVYLELNEGRDESDMIAAQRRSFEATKQLEEMLLEWIEKEQCAVEVVHIPIFTISPTNVIFLTPPHGQLYPTFDKELISNTDSLDLYSLNVEERSRVRRFASSLNSMLDSMNLKEDVFYMGDCSSLVARVLENSPVCINRRKDCSTPCSLILVDRTLDLCGVTSHASESVLDKAMTVLPAFPGHCNELAIDMSSLTQASVLTPEDIHLSPGCLFHANDGACVQTYDNMINKSQKEVMIDLYNRLTKMDVTKSPGDGGKSLHKVTVQSVEKLVNATKGNYEIISENIGLLQQALGVAQTLKSPIRSQMDLLANLETQATQSLAVSKESTSILHQITQLVKTRKEKNLPLQNLLALIVHVYSLAGADIQFQAAHVDGLTEALANAMFDDNQSASLDDDDVEMTPDDVEITLEQCQTSARSIMQRLRDLSVIRQGLKKYKSVLRCSESGTGHEYRGVVQQLVDDMVDSNRPDMPDLQQEQRTDLDSIKVLLLSSLNMLSSKKKFPKHPLDNQTVILMIIGGTTAEECKRLHRSIITSGVDNTIHIGSTKLLAPHHAMQHCLIGDSGQSESSDPMRVFVTGHNPRPRQQSPRLRGMPGHSFVT